MDRCSKFILTVIAVLLGVIAFKLPTGDAQAQLGACGDSYKSPCYVKVINGMSGDELQRGVKVWTTD